MQGTTRSMKKRLKFGVEIAILLCFAILVGSLVNINVLNHDFYHAYAEKTQMRSATITANRGTIYDRNMNVLAQSATVYDVVVSPKDVATGLEKEPEKLQQKREAIATALSELLEVSYDKIMEQLGHNNQYEVIKKKVEQDVADQVRLLITENKWSGALDLIENTKRYYPEGTLLSSVMGFTGSDSQGLYGLELAYDKTLAGTNGYVITLKDAKGRDLPTAYEQRYEAIDGNSLVLTIDETAQRYLRQALLQVMAQHNPEMGCAGIIMNVKTGEILAMEKLPTFDINDPFTIYDERIRAAIADITIDEERKKALAEAQQAQWNNKAISYDFQPGSTFKIITASAALEEGTSTLHSGFSCAGYIQVEDRRMACHIGVPGHGSENFADALVNSCNPAFVKIGSDLGAHQFFRYLQSFGFTEKTGIDLPGEGKGAYYTESQLAKSKVSLASCSFGQSTSVTAIQLVTAVAAAVNGGNLVVPHVVKQVLDANGNVVETIGTQVKRQVISEETSATMRSLLQNVVETKQGSNAYLQGYAIGGKSGTAQKQKPGDDVDDRVASYIGVAPMEDPEIAVYIMVDVPTSGDVYGSVIAAPAVSNVLSNLLPYLGFSPSFTEEEMKNQAVAVPFVVDRGVLEATAKLAASGFGSPTVIGDGVKVVKQVPSAGEKMPRDGRVILYTDDTPEEVITLQNTVGMDPASARRTLEKLGLNVIVNCADPENVRARVISQSIPEGTQVPVGTVIEIVAVTAESD